MNLESISKILEICHIAGIEVVVVRKDDHGSVTVSGKDKAQTLLIFSQYEDSSVVERSVGIKRIAEMISRLALFDLSKATANVEFVDNHIKRAEIKQGRRRTEISFQNPMKLGTPQAIPERELTKELVLEKEQIDCILSSISAMSPDVVVFEGNAESTGYHLMDETGDRFDDILGTGTEGGSWSIRVNAKNLVRLLKHSVKVQETTRLSIYKDGLVYVEVDGFTFVLVRMG